jgi:hypothetical protein
MDSTKEMNRITTENPGNKKLNLKNPSALHRTVNEKSVIIYLGPRCFNAQCIMMHIDRCCFSVFLFY